MYVRSTQQQTSVARDQLGNFFYSVSWEKPIRWCVWANMFKSQFVALVCLWSDRCLSRCHGSSGLGFILMATTGLGLAWFSCLRVMWWFWGLGIGPAMSWVWFTLHLFFFGKEKIRVLPDPYVDPCPYPKSRERIIKGIEPAEVLENNC